MIDRERERQLHRLVAGEASPEETASLEAWLAGSAEGRQRRHELETLFAALAGVPRVAPPPGLREDVLAAISIIDREDSTRSRQIIRPSWYLLPVAAAAVAIAIAIPWWRHALPAGPGADVSGSLAAPAEPVRGVLSLPGTRVALAVAGDGARTIATFDASSAVPFELDLEAPPAATARASFHGVEPGAIERDATGGRIAIARPGTSHFSIEFRPALSRDESVKVALRAGGLRAEGVLPKSPEDR